MSGKMYQDDREKSQQFFNLDNMDRYLENYNNIDFMTSWILDSPGIDPTVDAESLWQESGPGRYDLDAMDSKIQSSTAMDYQRLSESPFEDFDIYDEEGRVQPMEFEAVEPQRPFVVLLEGGDFHTDSGATINRPWIYLWKAEAPGVEQESSISLLSTEDMKLERARYVNNPEMQAAKAFYNALQILRRTVQQNETGLSPHLRTHHEKTNCEEEMLQSFAEYDSHATTCLNCCSALINMNSRLSLCDLGSSLARKVFLAIDWYATATYGNYESVTLEISSHSVWSLLLAYTQDLSIPEQDQRHTASPSLSETMPVRTLAVESLGIISSFLGIEDRTSVIKQKSLKRKRSRSETPSGEPEPEVNTSSLWESVGSDELLTANPELVVSTLDEYLNTPSRRKVLRSRIGQEGMKAIRRLFNVSLHGYNALERAFSDGVEEDYDFYQDFPNHTDLLSLGVQTFIELSNEKPAYPTALREVYSILHLCDSINQVMPQRKYERKKRVEGFARELKAWRNIIENSGERVAFELIIQIRWPSQYLQLTRRQSTGSKRIKYASNKYAPPDQEVQRTEYVDDTNQISNLAPVATRDDYNPMSKALLWMQLIAGIVFTTIAAYFNLNHRMVNAFVMYLTGGTTEILNSSRTIDNTSKQLPNNLAWISSSSIRFIDKTRRHIIDKLRAPEYQIFSHAVDVAMDSLSCGWVSTISGVESLLLRLAKLVECTKLQFFTFVEKVLDLCMVCAANMPTCDSHRLMSKDSRFSYNNSYRSYRMGIEKESWIADEDEKMAFPPRYIGSKADPSDFLGVLSGPPSPIAASYASTRSPARRISSDFIDEATMSVEDRLVSDRASYFPIENSDRDLSGGPVTAYPSTILPPASSTMDPVLTLENHEDLLFSQSHYQTHTPKSYSDPNAYNHYDFFWSPHRTPSTMASLPEHTMAPTWSLSDDILSYTAAPSIHYYPPTSIPTTVPTSLSASISASMPTSMASSMPTSMGTSLPTSMPTSYPNSFKHLSAGHMPISSLSPLVQHQDTPRFLPAAPTPPPPVPPAKPRKRRRSSPINEGDQDNSGQQPQKRQKKTYFFKCSICKHDIAAPRMNLTRHIRTVHADNRMTRISCEWPGCEVTFQAARRDNYRAHLRKHQEKLGEATK